MDRREFLGTTAAALAAVPLAGCASLVTVSVAPVDGRIRIVLAEYPSLAEVGGALRIRPRGWSDSLYLLAVGERRYVILDPTCTHRGCTVDVEGPRLVCPCHGSTYDRTGEVLAGPAERPLSVAGRVDVRDGELIIDLATGGGAGR